MGTIDISKLSEAEREDLLNQAKTLEKEKAQKRKQEIQEYRGFKDDTIVNNYSFLQKLDKDINEVKSLVISDLETVIAIKRDLFRTHKIGEHSQTLTTQDGKHSIQMGVNAIDGWNDEVHEGIAIIKEYLNTLISDETTKILIEMITDLLARNLKGDLKASRVMKLKSVCEKFNNPDELVRGLDIIEKSYNPKLSTTYLRAWKNADGKKEYLNLSVTK